MVCIRNFLESTAVQFGRFTDLDTHTISQQRDVNLATRNNAMHPGSIQFPSYYALESGLLCREI